VYNENSESINSVVLVALLGATKTYAQKEILIKQIEFDLEVVSDIDYENEYFLTLKLNKGSNYIFTITNNINDRAGDAIVELLDADNLILTNSLGEKYFNKVSFECNKTGFYDVLVRFKDNQLGYCNVDVTLLQ
jgi:hypothetical protein